MLNPIPTPEQRKAFNRTGDFWAAYAQAFDPGEWATYTDRQRFEQGLLDRQNMVAYGGYPQWMAEKPDSYPNPRNVIQEQPAQAAWNPRNNWMFQGHDPMDDLPTLEPWGGYNQNMNFWNQR